MGTSEGMPGTRIVAALAIVSTAVLAYELAQIRIFSYTLQPVVAYAAIALTMLGFGLGATILALRPDGAGRRERWLHALCLGLGASMIAVNALYARFSTMILDEGSYVVQPLWLAALLVPCVVPYVLAGMITTIVFQARIAEIGRLYFWNLLGSALGSAGMIAALRPVGADRIVIAAAALCGAASFVLAPGGRRGPAAAALAGTALAAALLPWPGRVFPLEPPINSYTEVYLDHEAGLGQPPARREMTEWDPIGRIDVFRYPRPSLRVPEPIGYRVVTIDGAAMTVMLEEPATPGWGRELFEESLYGAAYRIRKEPDVLVIGSGGGPDVAAALHWGARSVVGVEISLSTLRAVTGPYRDFVGWPKRPNVAVHHGDGRSFARSTDRRFDVVQMSGVDTMTNHTAGSSLVTAEDYLYTVEAFADFLGILEPGGVLSVTRFGEEALNLSAIAVKALRSAGVARPEAHVAAFRQALLSGVLVKREPFTEAELAALREFASRAHDNPVSVPFYDWGNVRLGAPVELLHPSELAPQPYAGFFAAVGRGEEDAALAKVGSYFTPPTDDKPYYILGRLLNSMRRSGQKHPWLSLLVGSSAVISIASLALILLPVIAARRRGRAGARGLAAIVTYFFSIGAGFMLLEIGLIHRATIFVSTPGAAVAVVITAILVASGLGALASDRARWPAARSIAFALAGLVAASTLYRLGAEPLFGALYGLPVPLRCGAAALAIAPAGFFMGWFFPTGLRVVGAASPERVPWAIAVNGFASVLGSLATLFLGVFLGFLGVFAVALAFYALAAASLLPLARRTAA